MKKVAIKVLNIKHGKEVIKYLESIGGVNELNLQGANSHFFYYIDDENIIHYCDKLPKGYTEITLPTLPNVGDEILVWDKDENKTQKRIFLAYIPQTNYSVITVCVGNESLFKNGEKVSASLWKNWKPIPKEEIVELTIEDISAGKGVGVPPHLLRIKTDDKPRNS